MAGVRGYTRCDGIATTTSAKTLLCLLAASNKRLRVKEFSIAFDGVTPTSTPIKVELLRSTANDGTSSAGTVVKRNAADDETIQATSKVNYTAEPTLTDVLFSTYVHPQGLPFILPLDLMVVGGQQLNVRVTAGTSVNAIAGLEFEE